MSDWERISYKNADEFHRAGLEDVEVTVRMREGTRDKVDRVEIVVPGDETMLVFRVTEDPDGEDVMTSSIEPVAP